jgi:pilus assembly protein FimV
VHFLIQVEWSGGRLIREYSALLDPPQWIAGRPAEIDVPETAAMESAPVEEIPPLVEVPPPVAEETLPPIGSADPSEPVTDVAAAEKPAAIEPVAPAEPRVSQTEPAAVIEPVAPPAEVASTEPPARVPAESASAAAEHPAPAVVSELAPLPAPEIPAIAEETPPASLQYGPVKTGENLYWIAKTLNTDKSLSAQQVMLALMRANPSAFFGNNVNNLKAGKILKVPEHETIAALPKAQAAKEFSAQYDAWQEYKLKVAGASRAVTVAETGEPKAAAKPEPKKAEAKKPEKVAKADKTGKDKSTGSGKAVPLDLLKIVRANLEQEVVEETTKTPGVETKKDAVEQRALTERVATLEEAIESKQMQNKEMRERVGKLQEQVKSTERLVDLENKDLALAQKQAAEKQAAEAKATAEKAAAEKAAQEKAAEEKAAQEKAAAAAKAAQTAKPAQTPKPAADGAVAKKPSVKTAPAPAPAEEGLLDGIVASISDNPLTLALLAVLGVLAVGVGGLYAYRRRSASREFSESILSSNSLSGDASMEASMTDTSGQVAASDTSFLSDFSQGGMGNIHTDEVDPIAEAEVYLAYGRDEQAEEILKDAIVKDPVRQELKGKLLEIYFQRNDVSAFETLAEELYAALEGKGGKVWDKAEEMGRKLSPNNPMFRGGKPAARGAAAATTLLVSGAHTGAAGADMLSTQGLELDQRAPPVSSGLDFSLDFDNKPARADAPSLDMTFDMDMGTADAAPASQRTSGLDPDMDFSLAAPREDSSSNLIDFNSPSAPESSGGLDFSPASNEIDFSSSGAADTEISLEGVASEGALPGWDETTTKLDLAKAYIDMGDSEGARSILDEVMAEGNDSQKRQARDLAAQIAA